jgi:hypothetical protein
MTDGYYLDDSSSIGDNSTGDHDSFSSSSDGSSLYSTDDDHTTRSSGSADDTGHNDDDDSSTRDVLMDELRNEEESIDDDESFKRRNSFFIAASFVLLAGLVLNFSYILRQLREVSVEVIINDYSSSPAFAGNKMKNYVNESIAISTDSTNKYAVNNHEQHHNNEPTERNKFVRDKTRIYTFTGHHGNKYRGGGILSDEMIEQYEEDGAIVFRNLIPPKLLDKLNEASAILVKEHQEKEKKEDEKDEGGNKMKRRKRNQFHMVKNGAIFLGVPPPNVEPLLCSSSFNEDGTCISTDADEETTPVNDDDDTTTNSTLDDTMSAFRELAMYSKIPRVAASLLRLDELRVGGAEYLNLPRLLPGDPEPNNIVDDSINLRICRDIFLTKDDDDYACGWHVDDSGFWPAIASDPGVNAWIALDDMRYHWSRKTLPNAQSQSQANITPVATFALSLGSHRAPWRHEAYQVTGSPYTAPPEGFLSAADMIERRSGSGTCNIKTSAPHLYEKLEEQKVIYDLKRGDVIFHDRWLFHRTVTVLEYENRLRTEIGQSSKLEQSESNGKIFRRYSIRESNNLHLI